MKNYESFLIDKDISGLVQVYIIKRHLKIYFLYKFLFKDIMTITIQFQVKIYFIYNLKDKKEHH